MTTKLILDTNVFYNLGDATLSLQKISSQPGEELWYSPLSALELAGKWSSRTFNARKRAAEAILTSHARELPDPEIFLTRDIFGYTPVEAPFSFEEGVKAMAGSKTMKALVAGVEDLGARVIRRVSVPKAHTWRMVTEGKWVKDMLDLQKTQIPKFSKWYDPDPKKRKGQPPKLKGKEKKDFMAGMTSHEWAMTVVLACQERALLGARRDKSLQPSKATVVKLSKAINAVACYCAVYTQYLVRLMTENALPEENDSGDLELFIYSIDDDHVVVTSEKKWKRLAEAAGFGNRVRLV